MENFDLDKHSNVEFLKTEVAGIKQRLDELSMKEILTEAEEAEIDELESKLKMYEDDLRNLGE